MEIYMDNAATTAVDEVVVAEMMPYFRENYGNPSSQHSIGREAGAAIDKARRDIAEYLGCVASEIYFTSGGTESDNWAIKGVAEAYSNKGKHIITSAIEHPAVINTLKSLEKRGYEVTYLPVSKEGVIDIAQLKKAIRTDTILVTIMLANNEIGSIQPIAEIAKLTKQQGIILHTDAVQALCTLDVNLKNYPVDLMSFSGHKIYGPKGVGVLYKSNRIKIGRFMDGGEQERGMRAGTLNLPSIVGMARAVTELRINADENNKRIRDLRNTLVSEIKSQVPFVIYNGPSDDSGVRRLVSNANFSFQFIEGEGLLLMLDLKGICVSSGSACSSGSLEPSHVLLACGVPEEIAHGSIRFSLSKYTTKQEIIETVKQLKSAVDRLRAMSPLFNQSKGVGSYV